MRIGKIVGLHALAGEVRLLPDNPDAAVLPPGTNVELRRPGEVRSAEVRGARRHQRLLLLQFAGVEDRSTAEQYRDFEVWIRTEQLPLAGANEYYYFELEGMEVYTTAGAWLGVVTSVMPTAAADVLVIQGKEKEYLVPMVGQFVKSIDRTTRRVCIDPIPGLLEP
ncbi:MAG: ribosome maturation factor RimM [Candidatus Binatia bacterium]|nr:ribosome maturation factor RimM [Candidatus Binatia bacterium]